MSPPDIGLSIGKPANRRSFDRLDIVLRALQAGPVIVLMALLILFVLIAPNFLTLRNLQNLIAQSAIVCALGLGEFVVILVRGVDVSVGSVIALSTVVVSVVTGLDAPSSVAQLVLFPAVGLAVGLFNGLLIVKGRIPQPLVVTVATLGIANGMALLVSKGDTRTGMSTLVNWAGNGHVAGIPVSALFVIGLLAVLWILLRKTQWGRWLYAVGGNPDVAQWLGLPRDRLVMSAYAISGTMAGFAGLLYAGRTGAASPLAGLGYELDAITAVIIGGASLFGGRGSVVNVLFGALIIGIIGNGLQHLDVSSFWAPVAIGSIIIVALEMDVARKWIETRIRVRQARRLQA